MQPVDFFRSRIDAMINLSDPLAVLATRLPWSQIETAIAAKFEHLDRVGQVIQSADMFGSTQTVIGGPIYQTSCKPNLMEMEAHLNALKGC